MIFSFSYFKTKGHKVLITSIGTTKEPTGKNEKEKGLQLSSLYPILLESSNSW